MAKRSKQNKSSPQVIAGPDKPPETKTILPGKSRDFPWMTIAQALVITAAVLWIYWPALHGDWLWDDNVLVTDNAMVHDPYGLWNIWFDPGSLYDYQPLKVSVVWLQWQLWGNDTLGYHLTNVFLHVLSALLVWRLLSKFGLRLAWLGGLIFAIHPVQVESVAWISELKNTLSLPPFLLAMCAWIDFDERGNRRDYFLALGLFLAAMLCKPTMVMFPVVILLYAWWKRGQVSWNAVKASAPFFVVSLALGLITVIFLHRHTIGSVPVPMGGFASRLVRAGLSLSFYFSKCFLPVELMPIYPQWAVNPPMPAQFLPWPILAAVIFCMWTKRGSWGRHVLLGLGFFLINLTPFVGFNTATYMAFTWVMDHVLYIPIIGLIGLVVAVLGRMEIELPAAFRPYGIGLMIVSLALMAFESRGYAKMFINPETLWTYELRHNSDAYMAHNNLGNVLMKTGRLSEAMLQFEQALQIKPDYADAHYNLGNALQRVGRLPEAINQFEMALRIKPAYALAHYNLGNALVRTGRLLDAIEQYEQAVRADPSFALAHDNLGNALQQTGQLQQAIEEYQQALRVKPDDALAHNNLGGVLEHTGQLSEAMEQYEQALQINPEYDDAHYNLGHALLQSGRLPEAIEQFELALQIKPDDAETHYNLGCALQQTGQLSAATEQDEEALRIKPDFAAARDNLARLQALQNAAPAKK